MMKNSEPDTLTVKPTGQETIAAVKDTTKAIELKNKQMKQLSK